MMVAGRKLHFQLTPLLDLLLIVIFAQYMEVRETATREEAATTQKISAAEMQLAEMSDSLQALQRDYGAALQQSRKAETLLDEFRLRQGDEQREALKQKVELSEALSEARKQRDLVGRMAIELFDVPSDIVEELLKPRLPGVEARTRAEIERIQQEFRKMSQQSAAEMVRHLLTFHELQKRCDIWNVHISENGAILLQTDQESFEFRARDDKEFEQALFTRYKSLPQPKSLVIILLSYGDAKAVWREAALSGLPRAADRMRADSNGRSRFEYALLGYRPDGPEKATPP